MFAYIRAFAKSPFATVIFGLLIVAFVIFGIGDVFRQTRFQDAVVQAGDRPAIDSNRFKSMFAADKADLERQNGGQQISQEEAVAHGFDRQVLADVAATESLGALMTRLGVRPADELIAGELRKLPQFFDPVSGAFDKKAYLTAIAQQGLTADQADSGLRDDIAQRHLVTALAAGLKPPSVYGVMQAAYLHQERSFTWFPLAPSVVGAPIKPTDAQLLVFIHDHAAQLTKPEMRQISVVHISAATLAPTIKPDDAAVQKRYNFEKDTLSQPEKRAFVQIPVPDAKTGEGVAAKLRAGGDPASIAKGLKVQPITYAATPKSAVADRAMADAAFALKTGEVSAPVRGDLGMAVLKMGAITPGHDVTLAEARPKIESEVKADKAKDAAYNQVQKYTDAQSGGSSMVDAAKAAGVPVVSLPPVIAQGVTLEGQQAQIPPKLLAAAFVAAQGADTDVQDLGNGDYWIAHVDKVLPPALPGLDEKFRGQPVRDIVTRAFIQNDLLTRLQAKAKALVEEINKGKTIQAVAAEVGAPVTSAADIQRSAGQQTQGGPPAAYAPDLINRVFAVNPGDALIAEAPQGLVIAKLDKISEPAAALLAITGAPMRDQAARSLFQDVALSVRTAAQDKIKPHIDYKRARLALGLSPDAPAPGGASTPTK